MEQGADINKEDNDDKTLFRTACENKSEVGYKDVIKYLVEQGYK